MNWKFWLSFLISGIFLYLAFRKVDWAELVEALKHANYLYLLYAMLITLLGLWVRSVRWYFFMKPIQKIGLHSLFSATMIGFMVNNLFPARLGEFMRAYAIGRKENLSKSASFATIVLERIFDGISILLFVFVALIWGHFPLPSWMQQAVYFATGFYFLSLIFLIFLILQTERAIRLSEWVTHPLPTKWQQRILSLLRMFVLGLQMLNNKRDILISCVLSAFVFIIPVFAVYLLLLSFGVNLPFAVSVFLLGMISIGVMIPSAPGYVGTFQLLSVACLGIFGVSKSVALSFSLVFHVSQYLPVTLVGLIYLFSEGLSLSQIGSSSGALEAAE